MYSFICDIIFGGVYLCDVGSILAVAWALASPRQILTFSWDMVVMSALSSSLFVLRQGYTNGMVIRKFDTVLMLVHAGILVAAVHKAWSTNVHPSSLSRLSHLGCDGPTSTAQRPWFVCWPVLVCVCVALAGAYMLVVPAATAIWGLLMSHYIDAVAKWPQMWLCACARSEFNAASTAKRAKGVPSPWRGAGPMFLAMITGSRVLEVMSWASYMDVGNPMVCSLQLPVMIQAFLGLDFLLLWIKEASRVVREELGSELLVLV